MITPEQCAIRIAAFLDGEGCISSSISSSKSGTPMFNVAVVLDNTDVRIPLWCKENFGGAVYSRQPKGFRHRLIHRWQLTGQKATEVLRLSLPYFLIKRDQAEIALALIETLRKDGNPRPKEVWETRKALTAKLKVLKGRLPKEIAA